MKTFRIVLVASMLGISLFAVAAMAGSGGHLRSLLLGSSGLPGHGGMHHAVAGLISEMDLRPDQQAHIDAIHDILSDRLAAHHGGIAEHLEVVIGRIEDGTLNATEARLHIDAKMDTMRSTAYLVSDELIALVHSLDDEQRKMLTEHLEHAQAHLQGLEKAGLIGRDGTLGHGQ